MMLHKAARTEVPQQPAAPMSHMAAAMELTAAWKLTQRQRAVHVGELCQERDGLGCFNDMPAGAPLMLWRMRRWMETIGGRHNTAEYPTHWMPFPDAPEAAA